MRKTRRAPKDSFLLIAIGLGFIAAALIWGMSMEWAFHGSPTNGQTVIFRGGPPSRQHYIYSTNDF